MRWLAYRRDADRLSRPPTATATSCEAGEYASQRLNVDRYLTRPRSGIEELGLLRARLSLSAGAGRWDHPFWDEQARDDLDAYREFVGTTPLRLGLEMDFVPGAEDRTASCSTPGLRLVSARPLRRRRRSTTTDSTPGRAAATGRLAPLLRDGRRGGAVGLFDILSHPDLVKVWGAPARRPTATRASTTSRPSRRSPRPAWPWRCRPRGCASRSGRSTRRRPSRGCSSTRAGVRPLLGRPRAVTSGTRTIRRSRPWRAAGHRGDRDLQAWARARTLRADWDELRSGSATTPPFAGGRRLVLGGVEIDHDRGLEGHSDADVLTHAVIDAILGAAGLGDLGTHFPPADEHWRDADSIDLLT